MFLRLFPDLYAAVLEPGEVQQPQLPPRTHAYQREGDDEAHEVNEGDEDADDDADVMFEA